MQPDGQTKERRQANIQSASLEQRMEDNLAAAEKQEDSSSSSDSSSDSDSESDDSSDEEEEKLTAESDKPKRADWYGHTSKYRKSMLYFNY